MDSGYYETNVIFNLQSCWDDVEIGQLDASKFFFVVAFLLNIILNVALTNKDIH